MELSAGEEDVVSILVFIEIHELDIECDSFEGCICSAIPIAVFHELTAERTIMRLTTGYYSFNDFDAQLMIELTRPCLSI